MNRIDKKFKDLEAKKQKALVVYLTAGYPDMATTERIVHELDKRGVDMIELGVPFSDPIADGPTIQAAYERALENGVNIKAILGLVRKVRKRTDIPIGLMTYFNPVYHYGVAKFVRDAQAAGADGVIVPDLPPEEAAELIRESKLHDFKDIFFLSPTSSRERMRSVSLSATGFIYYVSLTGVTGARRHIPAQIAQNVRLIKRLTDKPVCVGFGISTPAQARAIACIADGVIVGSAVIKIIEKHAGSDDVALAVGRFASSLLEQARRAR